jgi:Uma2 family endonuclease
MERMNTLELSVPKLSPPVAPGGVRLHRFTVDEYHRMKKYGVFKGENPIEMLDGRLYIKLDSGPPYGVPLGIPPHDIDGYDPEPYPQRRFTVEEYHRLGDSGALRPDLRTELVEGWVVDMMARLPKHDITLERAYMALMQGAGKKWRVRIQMAVTLNDAEPEPDIAIIRGPLEFYENEHPTPVDVQLVVEVAESTLSYDRGSKMRDYARNGIVCYWIINVKGRQIEVYTEPSGPTHQPNFRSKQIFKSGQSVPIRLGGRNYKPIMVDQIFPRT